MTDSTTLAPWLQRQLHSLLAQRGHALLLAGPSGLGQYELGLALASAWLCEQPSEHGACGRCTSCHALQVRTHADLCLLMPETLCLALGWPLDEVAQKDIDEKKRKPSKLIRVEAARDAVAFTQLTRARGRTKVVLVYPAERMNTESANTLLKTLEEPVGEVRFVLVTEAAHQLLPTIRSRCLTHNLHWPATDEALAWLQKQPINPDKPHAAGISPEQALVCLQAAGGRPSDALDWAHSGLSPQVWHQLPQALARGDWQLLDDWPAPRQLAVLQKLCHDLMARAAGAAPRYFPPETLPASPSWANLLSWSHELMNAARTVEHPFQASLMQETWAAKTRQMLSAPPPNATRPRPRP